MTIETWHDYSVRFFSSMAYALASFTSNVASMRAGAEAAFNRKYPHLNPDSVRTVAVYVTHVNVDAHGEYAAGKVAIEVISEVEL